MMDLRMGLKAEGFLIKGDDGLFYPFSRQSAPASCHQLAPKKPLFGIDLSFPLGLC